ncbi:HAD family hydrolase [Polycladidibacter stylochi]|uniref:HAD family hydrolase n=1 Tax=Polycladidibacter stylochi TaxID=1807766 RepID=UPI00083483A1|nr:HAD family phosphatase [Pseudovibrio stylochi]
MIKFIVFDLDEVLYDFREDERLEILAEMTGLAPQEVHQRLFAGSAEKLAEAGTPSRAEEYLCQYNRLLGFELTRKQWVDIRRRVTLPRPRMLALLTELKTHYDLALLTNNGALFGAEIFNIAPELQTIFTSKAHATSDFSARKPNPVVYERICAKYGYLPGETLFVDDRFENIEGAQMAGLNAIHFKTIDLFLAELRVLLAAKGA